MLIRTCDMCGERLYPSNLRKMQIVNKDDESVRYEVCISNGVMEFNKYLDTIRDVDLCTDCAEKVIRFMFPKGGNE